MTALHEEMEAYENIRLGLEADHLGKWALVRDRKLVGIYDDFQSAATTAVERFGRGPYLIRQVGAPPVTLPASVLYNPATKYATD